MKTRPTVRRIVAAATTAVLVGAVSLAAPSPAHAVEYDCIIDADEFVMWPHAFFSGGKRDHGWSETSYSGTYFCSSGIPVGDNASSSANYDDTLRVCAYRHASYGGAWIMHLPYGETDDETLWAYSQLGWASDVLSSHKFDYDCE